MPFKGTVGPQSGRTSRSQAESIGTDPQGFVKAPEYFPQGGHPVKPGMPAQEYKETPMREPSGGGSVPDPSPFTTKGG
jgi:hypothetical protein